MKVTWHEQIKAFKGGATLGKVSCTNWLATAKNSRVRYCVANQVGGNTIKHALLHNL